MTVVNDLSHPSITGIVDRSSTTYPRPTILPIRVAGTRAPVFCIHPIDGLASCYASLAAHLDEEQPIYGVQAPTPGENWKSLTALAAYYADKILAANSVRPIHLLGLSFGGLLAHAVAVVMQGHGVAVDSLTLLGSDPLQSRTVGTPAELQHELLAGMSDDIDRSHAEELLAVATHNEALAHGHFPGVYVGSALVVSAEGSDAGPAWHPFISGTVVKYLVPDAAAFEIVGPLVNSYT
ncbi:thioesterase domain-containing protein [Rhodococcus sp. H29-C3]|uniref:thioesterase domain-containing protein n=1 Tax=Rhodococcus sp. H29-C3 TaxID=3046307 RepID=UPI0024B9DD4F|nr:thioesterase domain-containing protein [Rhodococcus sp. H29-C3]MDJ0359946.1 thioesterase domain-containing protein [Rhodococcus sp. H29-C3]